MLFRVYQLLRIFYYPFFMWLFPPFSKSLAQRIRFEKRNHDDLLCRPFKNDGKRADAAFEISSEGELEQIKPVLLAALEAGKQVELIFSSDSVEKQCVALGERFSSSLRLMRYPLVSYFPGMASADPVVWISAPKLFLCRYDFFPELLRAGADRRVEFVLLSGSLKSYESKNKGAFYRGVYARIYRSFDKIVAATGTDAERFVSGLNIDASKVRSFDFRPLAIHRRLESREETLRQKFPAYERFLRTLEGYPKENRLIFGSFWPEEAKALSGGFDFSKRLAAIFPHRLDRKSLKEVKDAVARACGAPVYVLGKERAANIETLDKFRDNPGPLVVGLKGVLCESYADFGAAFVGGGHGVSVHSLMEPFMSGCLVMCGPKVHRSTEYDLIRENNPDRLEIVDRPEEVYETFSAFSDKTSSQKTSSQNVLSDMSAFEHKFVAGKSDIFKWLGVV